jgi:hypothetical protein
VPEAGSAAVGPGGNAVELGLETVGALDLGGSSLEVTFMPGNLSQQEATSEASPASPCPCTTTRLRVWHAAGCERLIAWECHGAPSSASQKLSQRQSCPAIVRRLLLAESSKQSGLSFPGCRKWCTYTCSWGLACARMYRRCLYARCAVHSLLLMSNDRQLLLVRRM